MAFGVTPSSGSAPYLFNLTLSDNSLITSGIYNFVFLASSASPSCPLTGVGSSQPATAAFLLSTGTASVQNTVGAGLCVTYTAQIVNPLTNEIMSQSSVNVSNI